MYKFRDLNITNSIETKDKELVIYIDDIPLSIEGLKVLNIEGRETRERQTDTVDTHNDGVVLLSSKIKERVITVSLYLSVSLIEEYLKAFEDLNIALDKEKFKLSFSDDRDYYYNAVYINCDIKNKNSYNTILDISFLIPDVYKYSVDKTIDILNNEITEAVYKVDILNLKATLLSETDILEIKNITTGKKIIIRDNLKTGDVIEIKKDTILKNGVKDIRILSFLESDFSTFEIKRNNAIRIPNNKATLELTYRGVKL